MVIIYHHVLISENEADQLFNEFDVNRSGLLDYDLLLSQLMVRHFFNKSLSYFIVILNLIIILKPDLNSTRMKLINWSFSKLDKNDQKIVG
jgi:hypothetical protein